MPVLGSPQAGMMTDPCREGGGEGARKPGTRGWRHARQRHGDTQAGDTQIGDPGARSTETQEHAGRRRRGHADANGPATGKTAANQEAPLPYFVPEFSPLRTLQTKGPVAKTTGPRFNVRCGYSSAAGSSVAAADSHDEQSVHSPAGSAHAAGSTAAGSETAAGSPAGSSVTARNSASSVWSS